MAYVLRMEDGAIDVVDLITGAATITSFDKNSIKQYVAEVDMTGMPPEEVEYRRANPPRSYDIRGIFDGKLVLESNEDWEGNNYVNALYAIDLSTGEVQRVSLTSSFEARAGNPILLKGEAGNDFFVMRDYMNTPYPGIGPEGEPREVAHITHQYALISKADFYASNPGYRDFTLS